MKGGDMARKSNRPLEGWEVALIKAMIKEKYAQQEIQAYFSRPGRSINLGRIHEIRTGKTHTRIKPASDAELKNFLAAWPYTDPATNLHFRNDELLIKAREAMIAAVHTFNGAGLHFRAELFIVASMIAWVYLLHAYYKRERIDYRYKKGGAVQKTPNGADRYWDLQKCLKHSKCPLEIGVINNLTYLLEIRHEIEHRSTSRIDDALGAKFQACCINFNDAISKLFGKGCAIEKHLPIALQFVTFNDEQRDSLAGHDLPAHIATSMDALDHRLSENKRRNLQYAYHVAFVPKVSSKASKADRAIEFVKPGSPEAGEVERVLLKEVEKTKFLPSEIVKRVNDNGHPKFNMYDHTLLARELDARKPNKGYGTRIAKTWYWYEAWFKKVMEMLGEGWVCPRKSTSGR